MPEETMSTADATVLRQIVAGTPDSVPATSLSETMLKRVQVEVTSAEILALNASPKTLVAAPGAGKFHEFVDAIFILNYNSAAYATNGVLSIRETDDSGQALSSDVLLADFLAKTADTIQKVPQLSADIPLTENKAMVLSVATGETITGDSPMTVILYYRTHESGL